MQPGTNKRLTLAQHLCYCLATSKAVNQADCGLTQALAQRSGRWRTPQIKFNHLVPLMKPFYSKMPQRAVREINMKTRTWVQIPDREYLSILALKPNNIQPGSTILTKKELDCGRAACGRADCQELLKKEKKISSELVSRLGEPGKRRFCDVRRQHSFQANASHAFLSKSGLAAPTVRSLLQRRGAT